MYFIDKVGQRGRHFSDACDIVQSWIINKELDSNLEMVRYDVHKAKWMQHITKNSKIIIIFV